MRQIASRASAACRVGTMRDVDGGESLRRHGGGAG
ncbi:MAG: hypothetical protein RLZ59_1999, partial [Pseudomonadota bacterium]